MDYVKGLSQLYIRPYFNAEGQECRLAMDEQANVLRTMQDFCSIMPATKLSNFFLVTFSEVSLEQEAAFNAAKDVRGYVIAPDPEIGFKLDVLIAMLEKVRLKKENYIEVMRSVKLFVDNKQT